MRVVPIHTRAAAALAMAATITAFAVTRLGLPVGAAINAPTTTTTTPTTVSPPTTLGAQYSLREVVSGWDHNCSLDAAGRVFCWGANSYGQLGVGDTTLRTTAVRVAGLPYVGAIWAGANSTCARASDGLWCWGRNDRFQLGDGTSTNRTRPVHLDIPGPVELVSLGSDHGCATTTNAIYCWGRNSAGQLGTNDTRDRNRPTLVAVGPRFTALAAFTDATCAQTAPGAASPAIASCTGANNGKFGNGSTAGSKSWVAVPLLTTSQDRLSASGGAHRCITDRDTTVLRCSGANTEGALGDGTTATRTTPVTVAGHFDTSAAGFSNFSCGFESRARRYRCWGRNANGQLGDGTLTRRLTPVTVTGMPSLTQTQGSVSAGRNHACAVVDPGAFAPDRVYCWGSDASGQLGNAAAGSSRTAVMVVGI